MVYFGRTRAVKVLCKPCDCVTYPGPLLEADADVRVLALQLRDEDGGEAVGEAAADGGHAGQHSRQQLGGEK